MKEYGICRQIVEDMRFYHGRENENPLETIPEFSRGKYWSIDNSSSEDLIDIYREDPEDDSFVLMPKKDVIRLWFVSYNEDDTFKPKRIRRVNPRDLFQI